MDMEKADLLIRYDEEEQKLKFYSATTSGEPNGAITPRRLPHLELELSNLRAKGPDEAERIVGGSVLVFFEFNSRTKTGIRDYAALGKQFAKSFFDNAREGAAKSDPDAQFELAMHHLDKSIKGGLHADLELAEKWLETSAANGCTAAREYLRDHWTRMKAYAERRIADRK